MRSIGVYGPKWIMGNFVMPAAGPRAAEGPPVAERQPDARRWRNGFAEAARPCKHGQLRPERCFTNCSD